MVDELLVMVQQFNDRHQLMKCQSLNCELILKWIVIDDRLMANKLNNSTKTVGASADFVGEHFWGRVDQERSEKRNKSFLRKKLTKVHQTSSSTALTEHFEPVAEAITQRKSDVRGNGKLSTKLSLLS